VRDSLGWMFGRDRYYLVSVPAGFTVARVVVVRDGEPQPAYEAWDCRAKIVDRHQPAVCLDVFRLQQDAKACCAHVYATGSHP
jgi:hypothetical protein